MTSKSYVRCINCRITIAVSLTLQPSHRQYFQTQELLPSIEVKAEGYVRM